MVNILRRWPVLWGTLGSATLLGMLGYAGVTTTPPVSLEPVAVLNVVVGFLILALPAIGVGRLLKAPALLVLAVVVCTEMAVLYFLSQAFMGAAFTDDELASRLPALRRELGLAVAAGIVAWGIATLIQRRLTKDV